MIVLTGGAGFIGSNTLEELNRREMRDVLVVDRLGSSPKWRNLRGLRYADYVHKDELWAWLEGGGGPGLDPEAVRAVIHLGACSDTREQDVDYLYRNNVRYSQRLWRFCARRGIPFVYASSAAAYGDGSRGFDDDHARIPDCRPLNPYGYSKHVFDCWALERAPEESPPLWAGLRFFNVYGPREGHKGDMASVVHKAAGQVEVEGRIRLFRSHRPDYGDGEQKRDFVYVGDAVRAILHFLEPGLEGTAGPSPGSGGRPPSGIYNVGTGRARTFDALARAVVDALGAEADVEYVDMPEDLRPRYQYFTEARVEKLRAAGYERPFTSLEEGVAETVERMEGVPDDLCQ